MKARNPSTGTLETVYVKALDSLPVGTQIEYTGDTIPTGWEEVNDYSADEVNTGKKWTDGKTIYRKVFTGSLSSGTNKTVETNIPIGYNVIGFQGKFVQGSNLRPPVYMLYYNNTWYYMSTFMTKGSTNWNFNFWYSSDYSNHTYEMIVEYTKN